MTRPKQQLDAVTGEAGAIAAELDDIGAELDAVTTPILWTRLVSIVDEAAALFTRSAFSTLVREANDFAILITDHTGRAIVESSLSIPAFIGTLPETVRHLISRFPLGKLRLGDSLITNDPWSGTGHIHDVSTATPIFSDGKLIGFVAIASHLADIGGRLRGTGAADIYEEGLQIPPLVLAREGRLDPVLEAIVRQNVRVPEMVIGDLRGHVAAAALVASRVADLLAETGVDFDALASTVCARSEAAMRAAIARVPDGEYRYSLPLTIAGVEVDIEVSVTIEHDSVVIDYTGSTAQQKLAINVVPSYTRTYSAYAIKALLAPDIPNNDGCLAPIEVNAPLGSILNPKYPAPTGARSMVGHQLPAAVMGAMVAAVPEAARASGAGVSSFTLSGRHAGRTYAISCFANGGQGASLRRPGLSALSFPSNMANTPIEILEREGPIQVIERSLRRGSGGEGKQRGGDGIRFQFRFVGDEPAYCTFMVTNSRRGPPGLMSGGAGEPGRLQINGEDWDIAKARLLVTGDVVTVFTAGGGGVGP